MTELSNPPGVGPTPVFLKLVELLVAHRARYRVIEHRAAGRSEEVARIRGTEAGQGAKAMACKLQMPNAPSRYVLAVLAADRQLDLAVLAAHFQAKRASLMSPQEIDTLTGCVLGAIPPFSLNQDLQLVADPELLARYQEIAFNAGRLDASIVLATEDYLRIAQPQLVDIRQR
ncbi:YbaK/prolyl-tRNA synthetase associated domain-containing protein [Massilia cavernae]|uniref:YbaK/prolyl-tRNA synthetase associated domain-containing protein n=1 Tax=Massilia cavernae TaxID=2320864 RepID=A0A418Y5V9_9BURK|nr:YbaK/prolyl-tRNA synthetase associated domain-containing protein [Massilia cavernae]RJG22376.1 YbaK/prolyl-tRNA synthetase associated domain-containing protein [Massilia cavernae]